jgi:lysophospholipase L1-like esterase
MAAPAEPKEASENWDLFAPTVAQAPDGSFWAAWVANTGNDWEIVTSRGDGESWGPFEVAIANPDRWDAAPNLAFDASGVPWLAWSSSTGVDDALHLSHWTGQGWATPQEVPAWDTVPNRQPVLAPAPDGGLWLAWVGFDGNDDEIYAAHWDGTRWSEPWQVSDDDPDPAAYDTQPRLGVGSNGSVWVAWTGYEGFLDDEVFAAHWDGQRWATPQKVSTDDDTVNARPSLAVADNGTVWLAWHGLSPEAPDAGSRIHAAQWNETDGWTMAMIISSSAESKVVEEEPCLTIDGRDLPHVTWQVDAGDLGVGYAAFDGARWSSPRWAVKEAVAESTCLTTGNVPLGGWTTADTRGDYAFAQLSLTRISESLPVFEDVVRPQGVEWVYENRHMAFGDSITWGLYDDPATGQPVGPYPSRLEQKLDTRVIASEVINAGRPGENTPRGRERLFFTAWPAHHPQYVEIMEGTNDITHFRSPNGIAFDLGIMVKDSLEYGSYALLGTVIPRRDSLNDETEILNSYIAREASRRHVPLVDNWQAFYDYGDWRSLYMDNVHPNTQGMVVLANSWYEGLLGSYLAEETIPPTTQMVPLPSESECGEVSVHWTGSDNLSWVADYDVQSQVNTSGWSDWLLATEETNGTYTDGSHLDEVDFRVRGRDVVGNQSSYSSPAHTRLNDSQPPEVEMHTLPPAVKAPFTVGWLGEDKCGPVTGFDVEFSAGIPYDWQPWLADTTDTSGVFDPSSPQYGETYYFRVLARDAVGLDSDWSDPVSTYLAKYVLSGQVYTVRDLPVMKAEMDAAPAGAVVEGLMGNYEAYLPGEGDYDLTASRDGFGTLPPLKLTAVITDMDGLDLYLPPLDDAVINGGFEDGALDHWQAGGTATFTSQSHTGDGAVRLEAASTLSQSLSVPGSLTNATLSYLVRLESEGSSTLQIDVEGTPISHTQVISTTDWNHAWLPVEAAVGQPVTLTFTVSNSTAVLLDEVSLGTARHGGSVTFFPIVQRDHSP